MTGLAYHIPALIVAIPLLLGFIFPLLHDRKGVKKAVFAVSVIAILILLFFAFDTVYKTSISETRGDGIITYYFGATEGIDGIDANKTHPGEILAPSGGKIPIRIMFSIDAMGAFMGLTFTLVALASILYSYGSMEKHEKYPQYMGLTFLLLASMYGMAYTGDMFNLFVWFEIASISAAAMIGFFSNKAEPVEAGLKYIVISSLGGAMLLVGIGILYGEYGSLNMAAISSRMQYTYADKVALILLATVFAMKAGSVPMHMWTPDTYAEAPGPTTPMLVTSSQVALYALFRTSFTIYGIDAVNQTDLFEALGWVVVIFGVLSMFIGVTMAIFQKDVKRLMAYHAISQTGYMLLGVGVGIVFLATKPDYARAAMAGGIFHIINHALYKGLLFLTAGAIIYRTGTKNLNEMGGLGHTMKWTAIFFMIGAAAISGIPPFNGFSSKLIIYESVYRFNPFLSAIAMLVSILTLASFVKVFATVFLGPKSEVIKDKDLSEVPPSMLVGMAVLAGLVLFFGFFPEVILQNLVYPAVDALLGTAVYDAVIFPGGA